MNATYTSKPVTEFAKGDIVSCYGGEFKIVAAPHPVCTGESMGMGPYEAAAVVGICLSGEVVGYFKPGSEFTFQSNRLGSFAVRA